MQLLEKVGFKFKENNNTLRYTKRQIFGTKGISFEIQGYFLSRFLRKIKPDAPQADVEGFSVYRREKEIRAMQREQFMVAKDGDNVAISASELQRMAIFVSIHCVILPWRAGGQQGRQADSLFKYFITGYMTIERQGFNASYTNFASKVAKLKVITNSRKKLLSSALFKRNKFNKRVQEIKPFKAQIDDDDSVVIIKFLIWFSPLLNIKKAPWYSEGRSYIEQLQEFLKSMDCLDLPTRWNKYIEDRRKNGIRVKVSEFEKSVMAQVYNPELDDFDDDDLIGSEEEGVGEDDGFGDDNPLAFLRMSNAGAGLEGSETGEEGSAQVSQEIPIPDEVNDRVRVRVMGCTTNN